MKNKWITAVVCLILLTTSISVSAVNLPASVSDIQIYLNGGKVDRQVYIIENVSYLPVRAISELLGLNVQWSDSARTISLTSQSTGSYSFATLNYGPGFKSLPYHGTADLVFDNGTKYNGEVKNGYFNGTGKIVFPDGSSYSGNLYNAVMQGKGSYQATNGDKYDGNFNNNTYYGKGIYVYADGTKITADKYVDGYFSGTAVEGTVKIVRPGQREYKGTWSDSLQPITMSFRNTFVEDYFNGKVNYVYADGTTYAGDLKNDLLNGRGKITYPDNSKYDGYLKDNLKHGKGIMTWASGDVYDGYYANDIIKGYGKYYYSSDGHIVEGNW